MSFSWKDSLRVWWSFQWRASLLSVFLIFCVSMIVGIFAAAYGVSEETGVFLMQVIAYVLLWPISFVCMHVVLKIYFVGSDAVPGILEERLNSEGS